MDYLTIFITAVILNILGGINYGYFAVPWTLALKKTKEELLSRPNPAFAYLLSFFRSLLMTYALAHYLTLIGGESLGSGLFHGALIGAAFSVAPIMNHHVFAHGLRNGMVLTAIDGGYDLVSVMVAGAILTGWK